MAAQLTVIHDGAEAFQARTAPSGTGQWTIAPAVRTDSLEVVMCPTAGNYDAQVRYCNADGSVAYSDWSDTKTQAVE